MSERDEGPKDGDQYRHRKPPGRHERMEAEDVDDDGSEHDERERHVTVDQKEDAPDDLHGKDDDDVVRDRKRADELDSIARSGFREWPTGPARP